MPKLLRARPPKDLGEERQVRKLAGSRHAPGDWIQRARMIARSWDGARTTQIAAELGCHPQTVRERIWRLPPRAWAGWGPARRRAPTAADQAPAQPAHRAGADRPAGPLDPPGRWSPGRRRPAPPGPLDPGWAHRRRPPAGHPGRPQPGPPGPAGRAGPLAPTPLLASSTDPDFAAKNPGRRALHPPAQGRDGRLRRRARPGNPPHLPTRTRLVGGRPPGQGTLGVRPWRGAGVVYGALRSVTARNAPSPPLAQHRRLEAAAAGDRAGQPDRGAPRGQRQPVQPPQPGVAGVAGRPPRIRQGFIPKRACWLHLQAGWWRLFRRAALAGRSLPTPVSSSTPRGWPPASSTGALGRGVGPSAPPTRKLRRKFVYRL